MNPHVLFNAKLMEFMQDLIDTFPNDNEFIACQQLLDASIKFDMKFPQSMFNQYIVDKYEQYLVDENEDFFLKESYDQTITDLQFVEKLKQIWRTLDKDNKSIVWKYMKCLLVLNKRCKAL